MTDPVNRPFSNVNRTTPITATAAKASGRNSSCCAPSANACAPC